MVIKEVIKEVIKVIKEVVGLIPTSLQCVSMATLLSVLLNWFQIKGSDCPVYIITEQSD